MLRMIPLDICSKLLAYSAVAAALLASAVPASAASVNVTAETTFYGSKDNCPPGGDIAHPVIHKEAGGLGTWDNPITYAGDVAATPVGARIYVFFLKKYFIMEDDCEECQHDWKRDKKYHFDLWMGGDTVSPGSNLIACENALTVSKTTVDINPPNNYTVDVTPLFNNVTDKCIIPAPPCQDQGNVCGNSCEIPAAATCEALETMLYLTPKRFLELNPTLDCAKTVPSGTSVCMGGTCGD